MAEGSDGDLYGSALPLRRHVIMSAYRIQLFRKRGTISVQGDPCDVWVLTGCLTYVYGGSSS